MRYLSIDVETTGLDPSVNQVIEVGAVLADTNDFSTPVEELPTFRALIPHENYAINSFCMKIHKDLWPELEEAEYFLKEEGSGYCEKLEAYVCGPQDLQMIFMGWLREVDYWQKLTVAGKNFFGFDHKFLAPLLPFFKISHRHLDPVMLYIRPEDEELPNLKKCCERAFVSLAGYHTAVGDARTVVRLIRCGLAA